MSNRGSLCQVVASQSRQERRVKVERQAIGPRHYFLSSNGTPGLSLESHLWRGYELLRFLELSFQVVASCACFFSCHLLAISASTFGYHKGCAESVSHAQALCTLSYTNPRTRKIASDRTFIVPTLPFSRLGGAFLLPSPTNTLRQHRNGTLSEMSRTTQAGWVFGGFESSRI